MSYVSIILPTYNERENIGPLIDEIINSLGDRFYEIIVVDDNSPDLTWKIVERKAKQNVQIHLLRRIGKRGLTSALNDGIAFAGGDIVVWMDCDFQMPPSKIHDLVEAVENGYDVAIGSRFAEGGDDLRYDKDLNHKRIVDIHRILSRWICIVTSILFFTTLKDWTSGFIAIRKDIFNKFKLKGDYGEYFMYLLHYLIVSNYKIKELPYVLRPRLRGTPKTTESYFGLFTKGTKYIFAVLRLSSLGNQFRKQD